VPSVDVVVHGQAPTGARARQIEALFDVPPRQKQTLRWVGDVPLDDREWSVGLIVGPSGSGKTTVAKHLFGENAVCKSYEWGSGCVVDDFPKGLPMADVAAICQSVGFNTIPAWLRPYHVLSNGEKFRVDIARRLAEHKPDEIVVVDEFTSVVDRQVAKIASHAVAKYVRKTGGKFVAVGCHYDVIDWLQPDWILEPTEMRFQWRSLQRRPAIEVTMEKVVHESWRLFAPFHYMSHELHTAAQCYCLFIDDAPAVIGAMLHRPHRLVSDIWGLSRIVTLPDFQGMGLAFVLMDRLAEAFSACGKRFHAYPAHPALINSFKRSPNYKMVHDAGFRTPNARYIKGTAHKGLGVAGKFGGRPCAVFQYVGPKMEDRSAARRFLAIKSI